MEFDPLKPHSEYDKDWCWQFDIRKNNYKSDVEQSGLTDDEIKSLSVNDFDICFVTDKDKQNEMTAFIQKSEWLGTLSQYTTHWFGAYYKGILAGVVLMNIPNAFTKLLGESHDYERLISRGACISWSPKGLASHMIMWAIRYMVQHTSYRLFTAYSDTEAKELGTIYQACNFYYLGKNFGANRRYISPYTGKLVISRTFRSRSYFRKYAKELGIEWQKDWTSGSTINWNNIPDDIEQKLRELSRKKLKEAKYIDVPKKHKYAYVLGIDKHETKILRREFLKNNKIYDYPKVRGQ